MKRIISTIILVALIATPALAQDWKKTVPVPIYDGEPGLVELYWKAWELAYDHLKEKEGLPQTPYMDEGAWSDAIWIWDTCFMSLFCRYAPDTFPGVESLQNFYVPLHDGWDGLYPFNIQHPDNPPLFAWVEYDYFKFTDDKAHIKELLLDKQYLQKHFKWFDTVEPGFQMKSQAKRKGGMSSKTSIKKTEHGYLWNQYPSGLDNTTREKVAGNKILWIDAISQQGLAALYISRLAKAIGEDALAAEWQKKYDELKAKVNELYWDEEDGIYYDIDSKTLQRVKCKTPCAYWPLFAEMASPEQAKRMLKHIKDPQTFGGERPWPTLARTDPNYQEPDGRYWQGGIWLPTAYMATKALEKYGLYEAADEAAYNLVTMMLRTYKNYEPHTIWECYSPTRDYPASKKKGNKVVRKDFCGWSALGPISMFIENIMGFHVVDAQKKRIEWRLYRDCRHGIENLRFGGITTSIITDGKGNITVTSDKPYTLVVNGKEIAIKPGKTNHRL